jgi:GNAT superfamily N-acetyltransferase
MVRRFPQPMQSIEKFETSAYSNESEAELIALQNFVLKKEGKLELWHWKNELNPYASGITAIAKDAGRIIGSYTVVPICISLAGRSVLVGQPTDTVVHPDYQRKGLLRHLLLKVCELSTKNNLNNLIGFPNNAALPVNIWNNDAVPICMVKFYERRLNIDLSNGTRSAFHSIFNCARQSTIKLQLQAMRTKLAFLDARGIEVQAVPGIPDAYDKLWNIVRKQSLLSVWKDKKYLDWRYTQHPTNRHTILTAKKDNAVVGLLVLEESEAGCFITELMVVGNNIGWAKTLVIAAMQQALTWGVSCIRFAGRDHGFFAQTFESLLRRDASRDFAMLLISIEKSQPLDQCIQNADMWTLTSGDLDLTY